MRSWLRQNLGYRPFLILLGLGFLVRLVLMVLYFPAWLETPDSVRFARVDPAAIFSDPWMPAGYAVFLRGLRAIVPALWAVTTIQHLLGLAVGTALFLAMRRFGVKPWLACVPAGAVFLSGDLIWLEHQVMTDMLMTALLVFGLCCAVRGLVPKLDLRWLIAASALVMAAALVRNVALVALPVLVVCGLVAARGSFEVRLRVLFAALAPAAVVFGVYLGAYGISNGQYLGIDNMQGWDLYARVGRFADCQKFTPPAGTEPLCQTTSSDERDGPFGYQWDPESPGPEYIGVSPETSELVGRFAKQAIIHQPLEYLKEVVLEASRYIDPNVDDDRPFSGATGPVQASGLIAVEVPQTRASVEAELGRVYDDAQTHITGRQVMASYESLFRLGGLAIAALAIFTLLGMFYARGAVRLGIFLFGVTAFLLYLVPVATVAYEVRYGLPPQPLLLVSGTLGFAALLTRRWPGAFLEAPRPDPLS